TWTANVQQQSPDLFSYNELVQLYEQETPPEALQNKLRLLLTTPFVNNQASTRGAKPVLPITPNLGRSLRVVQWNIERGIEYDAVRAALANPNTFARFIDPVENPRGSKERNTIVQQVALMRDADVIVLNEVDWGMKRTDYRNVAADLATALGMNYAYGVEFVEVDPIALDSRSLKNCRRKTEGNWRLKSASIRIVIAACTVQRFSAGFRYRTFVCSRSIISRTTGTRKNAMNFSRSRKANAKRESWCFAKRSSVKCDVAGA